MADRILSLTPSPPDLVVRLGPGGEEREPVLCLALVEHDGGERSVMPVVVDTLGYPQLVDVLDVEWFMERRQA